jgi:hypothetical protein
MPNTIINLLIFIPPLRLKLSLHLASQKGRAFAEQNTLEDRLPLFESPVPSIDQALLPGRTLVLIEVIPGSGWLVFYLFRRRRGRAGGVSVGALDVDIVGLRETSDQDGASWGCCVSVRGCIGIVGAGGVTGLKDISESLLRGIGEGRERGCGWERVRREGVVRARNGRADIRG